MIKNLTTIQNELKAPKGNYNSFGKYRYRSAEDILTAVKPLLAKYDCQLTIADDIIAVSDRVYVKATVTITDAEGNSQNVTAFARESDSKKGLDCSQITGTASSYARKYALNGMFLIDDTKDADTDEYHHQTAQVKSQDNSRRMITPKELEELSRACEAAGGGYTLESAAKACNVDRPEQIEYRHYLYLLKQLGAAA